MHGSNSLNFVCYMHCWVLDPNFDKNGSMKCFSPLFSKTLLCFGFEFEADLLIQSFVLTVVRMLTRALMKVEIEC